MAKKGKKSKKQFLMGVWEFAKPIVIEAIREVVKYIIA